MRFENVDDQKRDPVTVLVIELVEGRNLPPEGRSSVTAEEEYDGLLRRERRELDIGALIEFDQVEIGSGIAGMNLAGAGAHPHCFKRHERVGHVRHPHHDPAEGLGRLTHRPPDEAGEGEVGHDQHQGCASEELPHG